MEYIPSILKFQKNILNVLLNSKIICIYYIPKFMMHVASGHVVLPALQ